MNVINLPIPPAMMRTLRRDRCHVRRIGNWTFEVRNRRGVKYRVVLSHGSNGFAYVCRDEQGGICQSAMWGNSCRHSYSALMLCVGRNEMLKRAMGGKVIQFNRAA